MFKNGQTSVTDPEHSGRPATSTSNEKMEDTRSMVLKGRRATITAIAQVSILSSV
jgi:hypothetical protein